MGARSRSVSTAGAVSHHPSERMYLTTTDFANEPADLLPRVRLSMPNAVVDPFSRVPIQLFPMLLHENRVGCPDLIAYLYTRSTRFSRIWVALLTVFG